MQKEIQDQKVLPLSKLFPGYRAFFLIVLIFFLLNNLNSVKYEQQHYGSKLRKYECWMINLIKIFNVRQV